jgi:recombination protein RecT
MTTSDIRTKATEALQKQSQTNQVAKTGDKLQEVKSMLGSMQKQLKASLVKQINPEYVISTALTAIRANPQLMDCTALSLVGAIIQSNQLGLRLDGPLGHAYMVPYRNTKKGVMEAQFMPGYRGYLDLARRSGEIVSIFAAVVYANDQFSFEHGIDESLRHRPQKDGERGEVTHVYSYAKLKSGAFIFDVMRRTDVERIRSRSKAKDSGPWSTDWEEMAKKTVIRRFAKMLPMSVEFAKAVELDELATRDISQAIQVDGETGDLVHASFEEDAVTEDVPTAVKQAVPAPESEPIGDPVKEFGVKQTNEILARIEKAATVEALSKIHADIVSGMDVGEFSEAQADSVRLAWNARHAQIAPKTEGAGK